jgi:hypothetical protein
MVNYDLLPQDFKESNTDLGVLIPAGDSMSIGRPVLSYDKNFVNCSSSRSPEA